MRIGIILILYRKPKLTTGALGNTPNNMNNITISKVKMGVLQPIPYCGEKEQNKHAYAIICVLVSL